MGMGFRILDPKFFFFRALCALRALCGFIYLPALPAATLRAWTRLRWFEAW